MANRVLIVGEGPKTGAIPDKMFSKDDTVHDVTSLEQVREMLASGFTPDVVITAPELNDGATAVEVLQEVKRLNPRVRCLMLDDNALGVPPELLQALGNLHSNPDAPAGLTNEQEKKIADWMRDRLDQRFEAELKAEQRNKNKS